jgi:hypothetical protein
MYDTSRVGPNYVIRRLLVFILTDILLLVAYSFSLAKIKRGFEITLLSVSIHLCVYPPIIF